MTEQEVIDAILAEIPPTKRPSHVSDREFVAVYRSLLRGAKERRDGVLPLKVNWSDVKKKFGIED